MATEYAANVTTRGLGLLETKASKERKQDVDVKISHLMEEVRLLRLQVDAHDKTCVVALVRNMEADKTYCHRTSRHCSLRGSTGTRITLLTTKVIVLCEMKFMHAASCPTQWQVTCAGIGRLAHPLRTILSRGV